MHPCEGIESFFLFFPKDFRGSFGKKTIFLCFLPKKQGKEDQGGDARKRNPNPNFFGPDIFGWGGGLPHDRVGAKKFGMPLRKAKLFGGISSKIWLDILGFLPKSLEKKTKVCVKFLASNVAEFLAAHDVKIPGQVCGLKLQRVFHT